MYLFPELLSLLFLFVPLSNLWFRLHNKGAMSKDLLYFQSFSGLLMGISNWNNVAFLLTHKPFPPACDSAKEDQSYYLEFISFCS